MLGNEPDEFILDDATLATFTVNPTPGGHVGPEPEQAAQFIVIGRKLVDREPESSDYLFWWYNQPTSTQPTYPGDGETVLTRATPTAHWGDVPTVKTKVLDEANRDDVEATAEKMLHRIANLTLEIDRLPDNELVMLADGSTMRGRQVKALWASLDFEVTDATFGPGRGGKIFGGVSTFNYSDFEGWDLWKNGASFILLHELAHASVAGALEDQRQWDAYLKDNPGKSIMWLEANYPSSTHFEENEEFANVSARDMVTSLRIQLDPAFDPTNGYEYGVIDNDP